MRTGSVAVVKRISTRDCRESMQGSKIRAIDVDLEHRALSRAAALRRRSIQGVVRQNQTGRRTGSVAASKTMQGREVLRRQSASRYQAQTGYQRGQEEQVFDTSLHWLVFNARVHWLMDLLRVCAKISTEPEA